MLPGAICCHICSQFDSSERQSGWVEVEVGQGRLVFDLRHATCRVVFRGGSGQCVPWSPLAVLWPRRGRWWWRCWMWGEGRVKGRGQGAKLPSKQMKKLVVVCLSGVKDDGWRLNKMDESTFEPRFFSPLHPNCSAFAWHPWAELKV